jgi:Big-like domain-containing protein
VQLNATTLYQNCNDIFYDYWVNPACYWSSSNSSVATVSPGNVTGPGGGTATISATPTDCGTWYFNSMGPPPPTASVPTPPPPRSKARSPCRCPQGWSTTTPRAPQTVSLPFTHGTGYDCSGNAVATKFCGEHRNLTYDLVDKNGQTVDQTYQITESFSNFSSTIPGDSIPPAKTVTILAGYPASDIQLIGFTGGLCLASNDHDSMTQTFSVAIAGRSFPLTTVVTISRGNFSGTAKVDAIITTP